MFTHTYNNYQVIINLDIDSVPNVIIKKIENLR